MLRRYFTALLVIMLALGIVPSAAAQDYSFGVDREVADVYWNSDGSMSLDYLFTITNNPGAHIIDFYDVGLPSYDYDYNTMKADVNGVSVSVSTSDYQGSGSGVAVDLGSQAIQPGQGGTIHLYVGRISNVIYVDSSDPNYASAVFAPTYMGSQYVTGSTDLTVTFHLPPGVKPEEPRWHSAPSGFPSEPETGLDADGRVTYTWHNPSAKGYTSYQFGASFPSTYVPAQVIATEPPAVTRVNFNFDWLGNLLCFGIFGFMFFGIPLLTAIQGQRRKLQYMPPRIAIEGHGIKRGLTAVEAAVLMEQPLDKVMTMILFGALKKNAAQVMTRDPLEIQPVSPLPEGLHEYEVSFLKAFQEKDKKARQNLLQTTMVELVKQVSEKMRGFSRKETVDYYKAIMERAWQQIEAADTPEVKSQKLDESMEWTMLDRDYDGRMQRTFRGPIFVPTWWGNYDPTFRPSGLGGAAKTAAPSIPSSSSSGPRSLPGADFAASVVGGVQGFSSRVIGDLNTFTSRVTGVTNPPPKPSVGSSTRSGGGRAGGGCACACACACAGCACACAGGGR
jgi:hypothetical protein